MSFLNKAIARRIIEDVFGQGQLRLVNDLCTADFVLNDPALPGGVLRGAEAFQDLLRGYRDALADVQTLIEDQVAEGPAVVTRWTVRGIHRGELRGHPATGQVVTIGGITVDHIVNGRIAESWTFWDAADFLRPLATAFPPEARDEDRRPTLRPAG
jgi:steroid delta-isomerase-like uncharacterized protein